MSKLYVKLLCLHRYLTPTTWWIWLFQLKVRTMYLLGHTQIFAAKCNSTVVSRTFQYLWQTLLCQRPKALDDVCTRLEHKDISEHGQNGTLHFLKIKYWNPEIAVGCGSPHILEDFWVDGFSFKQCRYLPESWLQDQKMCRTLTFKVLAACLSCFLIHCVGCCKSHS